MKTNKTQKVTEHLIKHGKINSWEAIERFGETRLSAVIFNLRKDGYIIESKRVPFIDRFKNASTYVDYIYKGKREK